MDFHFHSGESMAPHFHSGKSMTPHFHSRKYMDPHFHSGESMDSCSSQKHTAISMIQEKMSKAAREALQVTTASRGHQRQINKRKLEHRPQRFPPKN